MHAFLLIVSTQLSIKAMFPLPDIKIFLTDFIVFNEQQCSRHYREKMLKELVSIVIFSSVK